VTTKSDFSEEEWSRIVRAPFVAGLAISLADPSGPIEAAKESMATVKSATNPSSREQLVTEVALDIQAEVQHKRNPLKRNPLKGYRPSLEGTAPSGEQVLVELSAVQAIVAAQATPEETAAVGQWLVASAQAAANAAKEGGFLGFGAAQISKGEKEMLDQVRAAVSQT
jgi:imidazolonepropionase-like amidohydrolase